MSRKVRTRGDRGAHGSKINLRSSGMEMEMPVVEKASPARRKHSRRSGDMRPELVPIESLPRGMPLEKALHPKKRCLCRTENFDQEIAVEVIPTESEVLSPSTHAACPLTKGEAIKQEELPTPSPVQSPAPSPAPSPTPSPAPSPESPAADLYTEFKDSSEVTVPIESLLGTKESRSSYESQVTEYDIVRNDEHGVNYGSESSDSEAEDDVTQELVLLSRVYQQTLDTPLDPETNSPAVSLEQSPEHARPKDGAMLPVGLFDFVWSDFPDPPIPPCERREPFSQNNIGPAVPCKDPYLIFTSIWDEHIMDHIVKETNRYAQDLASHRMKNNSLGPWSRINYWQDTCIDELYTYFAIRLAMGIVIKNSLEEYWSNNGVIFATPGFRAHMTYKRFQLLNTCLHFNDNKNMHAQELSPAEAKLFKIEPIIKHLNQKFQTMYTMEQNISLDESLLQWKGWLSTNQFISNKVAKVAIKTFEVCESQSGYLWRFLVHAHIKRIPQSQQSPLDSSTSRIVLDLLRGLEGKGYTVWMDSYYNSPALARRLKSIGFDVVGTLRTNRQFVPRKLAELTKTDMRPGQIAGFTSGDVDLMVWRDDNRVATISTYHGNETCVLEGKIKPCLILDYNRMMGGVHKKDQLLAAYPIERKRTRVWYKKIFHRLLNLSALNSYIICNKSSPSDKIEYRKFHINLVNSLLSRHSNAQDRKIILPEKIFEAKKHYIVEYPMSDHTKRRFRRQCCVCKKLSHYYCAGCEQTVCITTCFVSIHS